MDEGRKQVLAIVAGSGGGCTLREGDQVLWAPFVAQQIEQIIHKSSAALIKNIT